MNMPALDLNSSLAQRMLREALSDPRCLVLNEPLWLGWNLEKSPQVVHYKRWQTYHCHPEEFALWKCAGPSDCEWIVPGTL